MIKFVTKTENDGSLKSNEQYEFNTIGVHGENSYEVERDGNTIELKEILKACKKLMNGKK